MASSGFKMFLGMVVAGSMITASASAAAATSLPVPQQVSPWATLTMLSGGAPAAAACGAAVAAVAQAGQGGCILPVVDSPPPVAQSAPPPPVPIAPVAGPSAGLGFDPLLLGLAAVAAGVGLYFLVIKHNNHGNSPA